MNKRRFLRLSTVSENPDYRGTAATSVIQSATLTGGSDVPTAN